MATDKLTPTVCREITTVIASRTSIKLRRNFAGSRRVAARTGSKEITMNCLKLMATISSTKNPRPPVIQRSVELTPRTFPKRIWERSTA